VDRQLARRDPSHPYANRPYADPGYKPDNKKRYPIDTKDHTKAAWAYINMPKNQKGYTAEQVVKIQGRIKAALTKFGVGTFKEELVPDPIAVPSLVGPPSIVTPLLELDELCDRANLPVFELSKDDVNGYFVYLLLDVSGDPIYVGQSRALLGRLGTHLRDELKGSETVSMRMIKCQDQRQMAALEYAVIQKYQPRINTLLKKIRVDEYLTSVSRLQIMG
jgi:hypothetical protein